MNEELVSITKRDEMITRNYTAKVILNCSPNTGTGAVNNPWPGNHSIPLYSRFLFVLCVSAVIFLSACTGSQGSATPTAVPTPVISEKPTYTVQRGTVTQVVNLTGRVMPSKQQDLSFRTGGYVHDVFFKQGDQVKAGDVIARLDGLERYQADIASAQLAVDQATYDLQTFQQQAPLKAAQAYQDMVQAKAALDQAQSARDVLNYPRVSDPLALKKLQQDVTLARQALDQAQQDYANHPDDNGRLNMLLVAQDALRKAQERLSWATGKPTQAEIDQADAALAMAKADYTVAQATWETWKSGMDEAALKLAQSKVADAQARLSLAQKSQEDIEIRAPFDGQILSLGIAVGSQAGAFNTVASVADPTILEISAIPTPQDLNNLGVGQAASVKLSSHPDQAFPAHVAMVPLNTSSSSPDQSVVVTLDDTGLSLTLGEAANVTVVVDEHANTLWLPPAALRTFQGQDSVLVEAGGVQRRVDVRVGLKSADKVEILEGLEEGQVVVGP
jgi:HlyD family secretion protein